MTNDILAPVEGKLSPMQKAERLVKLATLKKQVTEAYNAIRDDLLQITQELDVYTLKTGTYTISRAKRVTPSVENFDTLKASLEKANIPYTTKTVFGDAMVEVFKQAIKDKMDLPGLEAQETEYVTVRVNAPKPPKEDNA